MDWLRELKLGCMQCSPCMYGVVELEISPGSYRIGIGLLFWLLAPLLFPDHKITNVAGAVMISGIFLALFILVMYRRVVVDENSVQVIGPATRFVIKLNEITAIKKLVWSGYDVRIFRRNGDTVMLLASGLYSRSDIARFVKYIEDRIESGSRARSSNL